MNKLALSLLSLALLPAVADARPRDAYERQTRSGYRAEYGGYRAERSRVDVSVGVGVHRSWGDRVIVRDYEPVYRPAYVPPPVYYSPPVYREVRTYYYEPAPVYCPPPVVYYPAPPVYYYEPYPRSSFEFRYSYRR